MSEYVRAYLHDAGAAGPAIKPGLLAVWRNRDTVQIGIDPRRAIALTGMRGAAVLLGLLDGSHDLAQVVATAGELGICAGAQTSARITTSRCRRGCWRRPQSRGFGLSEDHNQTGGDKCPPTGWQRRGFGLGEDHNHTRCWDSAVLAAAPGPRASARITIPTGTRKVGDDGQRRGRGLGEDHNDIYVSNNAVEFGQRRGFDLGEDHNYYQTPQAIADGSRTAGGEVLNYASSSACSLSWRAACSIAFHHRARNEAGTRQLVTRLGMAASPGSRGPVTTARTAAGTTPTVPRRHPAFTAGHNRWRKVAETSMNPGGAGNKRSTPQGRRPAPYPPILEPFPGFSHGRGPSAAFSNLLA